MNLPSLLLLALVGLGIVLALHALRKGKGRGCAGCSGCSCDTCPHKDS